MNLAGLVLAGGKATRFGGADKAFIELAGRPLLEHVLARLAPQLPCLAISANGDPARFNGYGLPVLPDDPAFSDYGPLAGVLSGLRWAAMQKMDFLLTSPVDTPFLPLDLLARLLPGPSVVVENGRIQALTAVWPVAFIAALEAFLRSPGKHKVRDALELCQARPVIFHESVEFSNINSALELSAAEKPSARPLI